MGQQAHAPLGRQQAQNAARGCQEQVLGYELTDQGSTTGAKSGTDTEFALAGRAARQ